jgi:hypothetical protein
MLGVWMIYYIILVEPMLHGESLLDLRRHSAGSSYERISFWPLNPLQIRGGVWSVTPPRKVTDHRVQDILPLRVSLNPNKNDSLSFLRDTKP